MTYEEYDLEQLEYVVASAKEAYQRAADRKRRDPATAHSTWNTYAHLLHALRLRKRALIND